MKSIACIDNQQASNALLLTILLFAKKIQEEKKSFEVKGKTKEDDEEKGVSLMLQ